MRSVSILNFLLILSLLSFNYSVLEAQDREKKKRPDTSSSDGLDNWILDLSSDDLRTQLGAAAALRELGPKAQKAVPALIIALDDRDPKVARAAQNALVKIVPKDLKGLIGALNSPSRVTRLRAVSIIHDLGEKASGATSALIGSLTDEENLIRQAAKSALGAMGPKGIPSLTKGLSAKKAFIRISCAYGILRADPQSKMAISVLSKELGSEEKWLRREAAETFLSLSPGGDKIFAALQSQQGNEDLSVREMLLKSIGRYGARGVPALTKALESKEARLRAIAARALGEQTRYSDDVTRSLFKVLGDPSPAARRAASRGLSRVVLQALPIFIDILKNGDPIAQGFVLDIFVARSLGPPEALQALLKILKMKDEGRHRNALSILALIGPKAEAAIPALLKIMQGRGRYRRLAFSAAKSIGFHTETSVTALLEMLKVRDSGTQRLAERSSGQISSRDVALLPYFVKGSRDETKIVRRISVRVLGQMETIANPALPALLVALDDPDSRVQKEAAFALSKMRRHAVPGLIKRLKDKDFKRRLAALKVLRRLGNQAAPAVPELIELLREKDLRIRLVLLKVLGQVGPEAEEAVPALVKLLNEASPEDGKNIVSTLGFIGPKARKAIPALLKFGGRRGTRIAAAKALSQLGSAAVPALIAALKSPIPFTRGCAARALGLVEPKALNALPPLISMLSDVSTLAEVVRSDARYSLGKFGEDAAGAVAILVTQLSRGKKIEKASIVETLKNIGPKAGYAVPVLIEELEAKDTAVPKVLLLSALGRIGGRSKLLGPVLIRFLKDKDPAIRREALLTLKAMGPSAEFAVPVLFNLLKDRSAEIRADSKETLNQLTPSSAEHIPVLIEVMKGADRSAARIAIRLLSRMGPKAEKAIPALTSALKNVEQSLRGEILLALSHIGRELKSIQRLLFETLKDRRLRRFALKGLMHSGGEGEALEEIAELYRLKEGRQALVKIGPPAFSLLLSKLKSENGEKKRQLIIALAQFGAKAESGIPTLLLCLKDGSPTNQSEAAKALGTIRLKQEVVVPALLEMLEERVSLVSTKILDSDDLAMANSAMEAIGAFGFHGRSALPLLTRLAKDSRFRLQREAVKAIGRIGAEGRVALPTLKEVVRGLSPSLRVHAIEAIVRVGAGDKATLSDAIKMAWEHHDSAVFEAALKTVKALGLKAASLTGNLVQLMRDHPSNRLEIIKVLGGFGPEARAALPTLKEFLGDHRYKLSVGRAIVKIEKSHTLKIKAKGTGAGK